MKHLIFTLALAAVMMTACAQKKLASDQQRARSTGLIEQSTPRQPASEVRRPSKEYSARPSDLMRPPEVVARSQVRLCVSEYDKEDYYASFKQDPEGKVYGVLHPIDQMSSKKTYTSRKRWEGDVHVVAQDSRVIGPMVAEALKAGTCK